MDFHYGEYTYNLAGGSEIYLSELLGIVGTSIAESMPEDSEKLLALAEDMSQVSNVTFSNPELLKVEQKSSEQAENDWLLTSLAAFDTEEKLTIKLTNEEKIVVRVTDQKSDNQFAGAVFEVIDARTSNNTQYQKFYCSTWKEVVDNVFNTNADNRAGARNNTVTVNVLSNYTFAQSDITSFKYHTTGSMTINGNSKTFTRGIDVTGALITWNPSGTGKLTFNNLIFDNGSVGDTVIEDTGTGALTFNGGSINGSTVQNTGNLVRKAVTANSGAVSFTGTTINANAATGDLISISSNNSARTVSVTFDNCTVTGASSGSGHIVSKTTTGDFNAKNGTVFNGNGSTGSLIYNSLILPT